MLMPSTMHALRTRRYSSTRYIHHTFHGVWLSPMEDGGRSSFQPPSTGDRAAHQVHYCSAVYRPGKEIYKARWNSPKIPSRKNNGLSKGKRGNPFYRASWNLNTKVGS